MKKKFKAFWITFISVLTLIIVGISGFTIYKLANTAVGDLLALVGIENVYLQGLVIIIISLILLALIGVGVVKGILKIIKR